MLKLDIISLENVLKQFTDIGTEPHWRPNYVECSFVENLSVVKNRKLAQAITDENINTEQ